MFSLTRKQINYLLIAFWILLVLGLPAFITFEFPKVRIQTLSFRTDYMLHMLAFFVLPITLFSCFREKRMAIGLVALTIVIAIFAELAQLYIPARKYSHLDMVFNLAGILAGWLVLFLRDFLRESRSTHTSQSKGCA